MSPYISNDPDITYTPITFHEYEAVRGYYRTGHEKNGENQSIIWCMYEQGSVYLIRVAAGSNNIELYGNAQDPIPPAEMLLSLLVFDEDPLIIDERPYADITLTPTPTPTLSVPSSVVDNSAEEDPRTNGENLPTGGGQISPILSELRDVLKSPTGKAAGIGLLVLAGIALISGTVIALVKTGTFARQPSGRNKQKYLAGAKTTIQPPQIMDRAGRPQKPSDIKNRGISIPPPNLPLSDSMPPKIQETRLNSSQPPPNSTFSQNEYVSGKLQPGELPQNPLPPVSIPPPISKSSSKEKKSKI